MLLNAQQVARRVAHRAVTNPVRHVHGFLHDLDTGGDQIGNLDGISYKGNVLSNALNPADNFFNGTRSNLGAPVSNAGDLPRLTGGINSNPGLDIDVVDVTPFLSPGDSSTQVNAFTGNNDGYFIARDGYREITDDGNAWALYKSLGDRRHHLDSAVRALALKNEARAR